MRLKDKVTVITGAGKGIGKETAFLFAKEGAHVIVTDFDASIGESVCEEISQTCATTAFVPLDVRYEEEWIQMCQFVIARFGRMDILVNNAGIAMQDTIEDCSYEQWRKVHEVNLDGVFLGTKHGIRTMKRNRQGSIINLSSIEGNIAEPHLVAYNSSKGGVRLLTKSAALHCAKSGYGIRVNSVHPGYLHTPMHDHFSQKQLKEITDRHPIGYLGQAIDVAYGILYLATEESRFVTGSELVIDGGYTAQ
ncbi:NAD(P)-dependent dehydrogenase, short-chain alcohol dehydrogenase family [Seinonella peptonophila]|uniref:NAD(P)-dependent dehydrogenase, short-chain alcohol dehydrogenase family n=1 Tax=Seinonella peptonophila TaxID=112248 RepID=A0A1M4SKC1_9BACL|nr:glucose 1-dehydrogenase [Seinonella peptonophila]SHE32602.1 NAD(P)-dependent dehydrogenase, short-chain alcohol dehydrogenase family [Seinonella peptonophila]